MCGIVGIFEFDGSKNVDEHLITSMCDVIAYRGPDDQGALSGDGFGIGARRLAIIDLSPGGHMPMASDDGRHYIVYNGEVYNYQDVRADLEKNGVKFKSGTDTEVILKAYLFYGPKCLKLFNGMFAFAIYDTLEKKTFIARDRLGIKPLYYTIHDNKLIAVSEIKSLWIANVPKIFNSEKFEELFCLRFIAGEDTIYKNVKKLLPGHYMELSGDSIQIKQWWNLKDYALNKENQPKGDIVNWYRDTFDDSVRLRKISDVPVGILLSGGLDSSSIAASLALQSKDQQLSSFTVRFVEDSYDEGDLAKLVSDKYHLDFNELYLSPSEIFSKTVEILKNNDEPIVHGSDIFLNDISSFAKSKVTVLLSGEGGDETLGGYIRYDPLRYERILKLGFMFRSLISALPIKGNRLNKLVRMLSLKNVDNFVLYNSSEILPFELEKLGLKRSGNINYRKSILEDAKNIYKDDPLRQVMYYDMHTYLCSLLDRNDLMTMRASIECRVPFLDYRLVEGLASLPSSELFRSNISKKLLRDALGKRLPGEILSAKKWGFGVPWKKYYRTDPNFKAFITNLYKHKLVTDHFDDPLIIKGVIQSFLDGDDTCYYIINQLFNICLWYDVNFEHKTIEINNEQQRKNIFYVGNFLEKHGKTVNFNMYLIPRLLEYYNVISTSTKKLKAIRLFDMVSKLFKMHKKVDIVIIDVYTTDAFWYAFILSLIARFFKIPYINMLHGGNLQRRLNYSKTSSKILFGNSYKNISPSLYLKDVFAKANFKADYIPNFIDIDQYDFKERKNIKFNLFWLRAFHKIYNPTLAVKILKVLVDNGYDAQLCMVGPDYDGTEKEVRNLADKLKVADRLKITGKLSRVDWCKLSEDYDIFINTTNVDNHPVSVLEAMALGIPVVSTNVGGLPYLIEDGVEGVLNPPDNAEVFAKSIIDLVANPEKVLFISNNERKKAETFTWPVLKHKWQEILK